MIFLSAHKGRGSEFRRLGVQAAHRHGQHVRVILDPAANEAQRRARLSQCLGCDSWNAIISQQFVDMARLLPRLSPGLPAGPPMRTAGPCSPGPRPLMLEQDFELQCGFQTQQHVGSDPGALLPTQSPGLACSQTGRKKWTKEIQSPQILNPKPYTQYSTKKTHGPPNGIGFTQLLPIVAYGLEYGFPSFPKSCSCHSQREL